MGGRATMFAPELAGDGAAIAGYARCAAMQDAVLREDGFAQHASVVVDDCRDESSPRCEELRDQ